MFFSSHATHSFQHRALTWTKLCAVSLAAAGLLGTVQPAQAETQAQAAAPAAGPAGNHLEKIETNMQTGDKLELRLQLSDPAPQPLTFSIDNPARISVDLPGTSIALPSRRIDVKRGGVDTINAVEANGRTRVVLNLDTMVAYDTRVEGNTVFVSLGKSSGAHSGATASTPAATGSRAAGTVGGLRNIDNIDFRRGPDGSGRVVVQLSDGRIPAALHQEGDRILVDFSKTSIADALMRRYDVEDFATPVDTVDAVRAGDGTRLVIASHGDFEQAAYQTDNQYTIEIKPVVKQQTGNPLDKKEYTGEKLTLNFQDIETRAVLQLLADTSGQNMVISDTVLGNVTLRLQNVPWDQALDIVMRTKGLDKRQEGNVIIVAPAAEIAAREKQLAASQKELSEVAPLRTEYMQINYAKAANLAALIKQGKGNSLLSERGNVSIDERTNTLLLQDTADRLDDIRRLVSTLDIPIRQVLIEARIVVVSDDFSRELGVQFGVSDAYGVGNALGTIGAANYGGSNNNVIGSTSSSTTTVNPTLQPTRGSAPTTFNPGDGNSRYLVNLPVASPAGQIALSVINAHYALDLALSAAQAENRSETISSPRVITANQKEATIEQGVEIPYQESSSSGATTTQFKKAVLSLKATPQITPDNRVIMDLTVSKDSVGQLVASATGGFVPSIDTRKIVTQTLVNDGQTIVLGGILDTVRSEAETKVPILGDIPILGYLFRTTTRTNNKDELLIFITPRILREGVPIN